MTDLSLNSVAPEHSSVPVAGRSALQAVLAAAVLGFFIVTFDVVAQRVASIDPNLSRQRDRRLAVGRRRRPVGNRPGVAAPPLNGC